MHTFNNIIIAVAACAALSCFTACSGSGTTEADHSADSTAIDSLSNAADPNIDASTAIGDTLPGEPSELGIPARRFANRDEALRFMKNSGHWDEYATGIILPMLDGETFEYADRLLNNGYKYFIVVDKQSMSVALFDRFGNLVHAYPMACARNYGTKRKRSDCRTPEGFFYAQGVYDSTDWLYTDDNGYTSPTRGVYGPRFIRICADVTATCGIHGTGSPGSIGRRVSHGCVRVNNASILDLVKYAKAGMPIIINPSDRDMAVNRSEGNHVIQINTRLSKSDLSVPVGPTPSSSGSTTSKAASTSTSKGSDESSEKTAEPDAPATPDAPTAPEAPAAAPAVSQPDSLSR